MYFHDKDPEYAEKMVDWFLEVAIKNHIIHRYKNDPSKKRQGNGTKKTC